MTNQNQETIKFQAGKSYFHGWASTDHVTAYEIIKRTACFVTILSLEGEKRCKITVCNGVETINPCGDYSMAPILRANSEVKKVVEVVKIAEETEVKEIKSSEKVKEAPKTIKTIVDELNESKTAIYTCFHLIESIFPILDAFALHNLVYDRHGDKGSEMTPNKWTKDTFNEFIKNINLDSESLYKIAWQVLEHFNYHAFLSALNEFKLNKAVYSISNKNISMCPILKDIKDPESLSTFKVGTKYAQEGTGKVFECTYRKDNQLEFTNNEGSGLFYVCIDKKGEYVISPSNQIIRACDAFINEIVDSADSENKKVIGILPVFEVDCSYYSKDKTKILKVVEIENIMNKDDEYQHSIVRVIFQDRPDNIYTYYQCFHTEKGEYIQCPVFSRFISNKEVFFASDKVKNDKSIDTDIWIETEEKIITYVSCKGVKNGDFFIFIDEDDNSVNLTHLPSMLKLLPNPNISHKLTFEQMKEFVISCQLKYTLNLPKSHKEAIEQMTTELLALEGCRFQDWVNKFVYELEASKENNQ